MNLKKCESLINYGLSKGASFVELFFENTNSKKIIYLDSRVDKVLSDNINGVGVRLVNNGEIYYGYCSNPTTKKIISLIDSLSSGFVCDEVLSEVHLTKNKVIKNKYKFSHSDIGDIEKCKYLKDINDYTYSVSDLVSQVSLSIIESDSDVVIASSNGKYTKDTRALTRVFGSVIVSRDGKITNSNFNVASSSGYELFLNTDFKSKMKNCVDVAVLKLDPIPFAGGEMPVIVGNGFGGVIIHEACGHAMEATSVAKNVSVLSDKLGSVIASELVNIVDDGTILEGWGSLNYDDEGNRTKKNVLVENGVLKSFLVDELNSKIMNHPITGSGRRENYTYIPTSRMTNTYLVPGESTVDEMIESIEYGLYAKNFSGGVVNPATGEFNFAVTEGYVIESGKIKGIISDASLIGTSIDILKNIDMVGNDFEDGFGMCGSESGSIAVCASQPSIRVSKILVGGSND